MRVISAPTVVTYTTGLFLVPFLPAAVFPSLVVLARNNRSTAGAAVVKVNSLDSGKKTLIAEKSLTVPPKSVAREEINLQEVESLPAEVVLSSSAPIEYSVSVVNTYSFDMTQDLVLFAPQTSLARLGRVESSRTRGSQIVSSGPLPIPNVAQIPDIRVYLSSFSRLKRLVRVILEIVDGSDRKILLDRQLEIGPGAGAAVEQDLSLQRGRIVVATVVSSRDVLPSVELIKTFQADAGNESIIWLTPRLMLSGGDQNLWM